jgi:hypothetical protein
MRKITKNLSSDSRFPSRDLNQRPAEYEAEVVLIPRLQRQAFPNLSSRTSSHSVLHEIRVSPCESAVELTIERKEKYCVYLKKFYIYSKRKFGYFDRIHNP